VNRAVAMSQPLAESPGGGRKPGGGSERRVGRRWSRRGGAVVDDAGVGLAG
jgi:hypothetical protein